MEPAVYPALLFIPLLPLIGATVLCFFGSRMERGLVSMIALSTVFGSFVLSAAAMWTLFKTGVPLTYVLWDWMAVGRYTIELAFGYDELGGTLMLVVTGVGFLIHVYSTEYMHDDPAYWRFFAYLNLFIFAMSVLVIGRSLPVMFIGWEGVGLASYLLIGFWYTDPEKAKAGKKAFITNRVGDFGFLIGMFTLISLFGTLDYAGLQDGAQLVAGNLDAKMSTGLFVGLTPRAVITFACLSLFVGACGKSAQLPLYVWLPDAMAGPTPVSALIHAATMVTAGVYMVARLHFIFDMAPIAMDVVAWVGGLTAIFAATIGLAQNDIKKVLAYSTVSQLGYMFLAAGLGAYGVAVFHLVTHAFFKACLFLGSGTVIHALHGEQDMRRMGGLKTKLPVVYWTFGISTLALAGVFPLSGFFSKDAILAYAYQEKFPLWILGFIAAGLTALYMSRLVCLTFYGEYRLKDANEQPVHVHKPHFGMKGPLIVLAGLAAVAGVFNLPHVIAHLVGDQYGVMFEHFVSDATKTKAMQLSAATEWGLMGASVVWALIGLFLGYAIYKNGPSPAMEKFVRSGAGRVAHVLLYGKWFVDEIYQFVIIGPLRMLASLCAVVVDPWLIDGAAVRGSGYSVMGIGRLLSKLQTGNVQSYATVLVVAIAAILLWAVQ
ncbi:MAG: NADH-quinone oxidoreductase subunit L [Deltaproteobacteria bacterium]|jgi:NADH-quinone oxidoreductase subunit L